MTVDEKAAAALADALDRGAQVLSPNGRNATAFVRSAYGRLTRAGIDRGTAAREAIDLMAREAQR